MKKRSVQNKTKLTFGSLIIMVIKTIRTAKTDLKTINHKKVPVHQIVVINGGFSH